MTTTLYYDHRFLNLTPAIELLISMAEHEPASLQGVGKDATYNVKSPKDEEVRLDIQVGRMRYF